MHVLIWVAGLILGLRPANEHEWEMALLCNDGGGGGGGGGRFKDAHELLNLIALKVSMLYKILSFNVWVRYFVWNFKRYLWNSTQNILPIHWKMRILFTGENLRAIRFKSPSVFLKRPTGRIDLKVNGSDQLPNLPSIFKTPPLFIHGNRGIRNFVGVRRYFHPHDIFTSGWKYRYDILNWPPPPYDIFTPLTISNGKSLCSQISLNFIMCIYNKESLLYFLWLFAEFCSSQTVDTIH